MESLAAFGPEMAAVAVRAAAVDGPVAEATELRWAVAAGRRLRGFADAVEAYGTFWLEQRERELDELAAGRGSDPQADGGADGAGETSDGGIGEDRESDSAGGNGAGEGSGGSGDAGSAGGERAGGGGGDGEEGLPWLRPAPPESSRERQRRLLRAKWLHHCQLFAAAWHAGTVTTAHVDVLAHVLQRLEPGVMADVVADEAALVHVAGRSTPESFAAHLRRRVDEVRGDGGIGEHDRQRKDSKATFWPDHEANLCKLFCQIDPIRGEAIFRALQARIDLMTRNGDHSGMTADQLAAQALHDLVTHTCTHAHGNGDTDDVGDDVAAGVGVEVLIVVDHQSVVSGAHAHTVCETGEGLPIPVSLAQHLCGSAAITVAITAADGRILSVGHCERFANRAQRRALRAMYRTCAHPDCQIRFSQCQVHHVTPWEHHGPTDLGNLLPLCYRHHHLVHEGGWRLTIDAQRTLRWYRPGGDLERTSAFEPIVTPPAARDTTADGAPVTSTAEGPAPGPAPPSVRTRPAATTTPEGPMSGPEPSSRRASAQPPPAASTSETPTLFDDPPAA